MNSKLIYFSFEIHTMKLHYLITTVTCLCLMAPSAVAQENQDSKKKDADINAAGPVTANQLWQARLPGGEYMVALRNIVSISRHVYVIDGTTRVNEVVVDTGANSLTRFYHVMPLAEYESSRLLNSSTGQNISSSITEDISPKVLKQYPTTTHAKTVEFILAEEKNLLSLFSSVKSAWTSGKGKVFTVKAP